MSLNVNISENSSVSEQANVVPNKTIASRLREAHGTTGETVATAIPGAGPVMCVDTVITEVDGINHYALTKTFNEIKQAIDNNIFVFIKRWVMDPGSIAQIEYIYQIANSSRPRMFYVRAFTSGGSIEYSTDNSDNYPERSER